MNHTRVYDYLTRSRAIILSAARPLTDEHYRKPFPIGPGSLAGILTHTYISEWYYVERILARDVPPYEQWEIRDENPPTLPELEERWNAQAARTRDALASITDWNAPVNYTVTTDNTHTWRVSTNVADVATQLALHEMHHRAQALNVLRHLGVTFNDDLDFNAMMYHRVEVK
jgi:uncharacterized damage-inducible protein DinB